MRILHLYFWSVQINGQVGQGEEDGLVWSDCKDDLDSEYIGLDGSPDD